jgi:hypothetical protein
MPVRGSAFPTADGSDGVGATHTSYTPRTCHGLCEDTTRCARWPNLRGGRLRS